MKLCDLLDELRNGILHDVTNQVAGSINTDQLWSDERLVRYINEAQRRFARLGLILRDGTTPSCTQFKTTAVDDNEGNWSTELDPSVIAVLSCRMIGDTADLARAGHSAFDTYREPDTYFFDPSSLSTIPPGKPVAYDTDETLSLSDDGQLSVVTLRLYPAPSTPYVGVTGQLRVIRMPLEHLTIKNLNAEPEIPTSLHIDMLDWAAYLALRKVDIDASMPERAQEFRQSFEAHVEEARREMQKKLFTPMQWSFGRNGFSWENG